MKTCSKCKEEKALDQFYKHSKNRDGLQGSCKGCISRGQQEWYRKNREDRMAYTKQYHRDNPDYMLMNKFKITRAQYDAMLEDQGGGCAICGEVNPNGWMLAVDHDHSCCPGKKSCGKCVRELLCNLCNSALGKFKDDAQLLKKAIQYIERHNQG